MQNDRWMLNVKSFFLKVWQKITQEPGFAGRLLLVLFVLALLVGAMILSGPKPGGEFDPLATPTPAAITMDATIAATERPLSSEYGLTDGVILAVVTILFVVGIGTLLFLRSTKNA